MTALDDIAARGACRAPDRPAIVVPGGGTLRYAELDHGISGGSSGGAMGKRTRGEALQRQSSTA